MRPYICDIKNNYFYLILTDVPEEGELRLYQSIYSSNYYRGQLQVWVNGQWGVVFDNSWSSDDTNTVCRQLGRNGKICRCIIIQKYRIFNAGIGKTSYYSYNDDFPVVMSNVQCVGTESRLIDCPYTSGGRALGRGSLVSLKCSSTGRLNNQSHLTTTSTLSIVNF